MSVFQQPHITYFTLFTLNILVVPDTHKGWPTVITIKSPTDTSPASRADWVAFSIISSVSWGSLTRRERQPQLSARRRTVFSLGDSATIVCRGRKRDM